MKIAITLKRIEDELAGEVLEYADSEMIVIDKYPARVIRIEIEGNAFHVERLELLRLLDSLVFPAAFSSAAQE